MNEKKSEYIINVGEVMEILQKKRTTISKWINLGILPTPLNYRPPLAGKLGRSSELFWNREEMNETFRQLGVYKSKT